MSGALDRLGVGLAVTPTPTPLGPASQDFICASGTWDWNGGNPCRDGGGTIIAFSVITGHRYQVRVTQTIASYTGACSRYWAFFPNYLSGVTGRNGLAASNYGGWPNIDPGGAVYTYTNTLTEPSDYTGVVAMLWYFDNCPWNNATGTLRVQVWDLG